MAISYLKNLENFLMIVIQNFSGLIHIATDKIKNHPSISRQKEFHFQNVALIGNQ